VAKRFFIVFWLMAAYAVVFAHSVVPHHHEQEEHAAVAHHHHHHDEDHHDDTPDAGDKFQFFQHQDIRVGQAGLTFKFSAADVSKDLAQLNQALQQLIHLCDEGPPLQHFGKQSDRIPLQQEHFYFFSVKAPPACS
jgi:hypothetical protein